MTNLREKLARAIAKADDGFGYTISLTRLVDDVATYTVTIEGDAEKLKFDDHETASLWVDGIRQHRRADAILSTLTAEGMVEQAFREGFTLGDFAGGGNADPRTVDLAWQNSCARLALEGNRE